MFYIIWFFLLDPDSTSEVFLIDTYNQIYKINIKSGIINKFYSIISLIDESQTYNENKFFYFDKDRGIVGGIDLYNNLGF